MVDTCVSGAHEAIRGGSSPPVDNKIANNYCYWLFYYVVLEWARTSFGVQRILRKSGVEW